jgi:hypothetical protein
MQNVATARAALVDLCAAGSPVLRPDSIDKTLAIAVRRWRSYNRRHPRHGSDDLLARTEDLAKGLRNALEPDPALTGPLLEDYRHLAAVLSQEFTT